MIRARKLTVILALGLSACSSPQASNQSFVPATSLQAVPQTQDQPKLANNGLGTATGFTVYRFNEQWNNTDGGNPGYGSLVMSGGMLYGTTTQGGQGGGPRNCSNISCGVIFKVDPSTGTTTTAYAFPGGKNGGIPWGGLLAMNGMLYGTTEFGGVKCANDPTFPNGCGIVYAFNPATGTETVLHRFLAGSDGALPISTLIQHAGSIYGTTTVGGSGTCNFKGPRVHGCGTVFSIDASGTYRVLYSFHGKNGANPVAGVIYYRGSLYGTTRYGGLPPDCKDNRQACGTVFKLSLAGAETILHRFPANSTRDGRDPLAGLVAHAGRLYGTTAAGGTHNGGTVFSINPTSGTERVVYNFPNAYNPVAPLMELNGMLYGTTMYNGPGARSAGIVFSVDPTTGKESTLYEFNVSLRNGKGANPQAGLTAIGNALYGTTFNGGTGCPSLGCGVVFKVVLP